MALSEKEQELLAQMEAALAAEDPKLANTLGGTSMTGISRRRAPIALAGFIAGIALLVWGIDVHWAVSVAGFLLMLGSTIFVLTGWRRGATPSGAKAPRQRATDRDFMDRLEERWRRRQDGDS